jgi:hypothetical protein
MQIFAKKWTPTQNAKIRELKTDRPPIFLPPQAGSFRLAVPVNKNKLRVEKQEI